MPGKIGISKAILDAEKRKRARRESPAPQPMDAPIKKNKGVSFTTKDGESVAFRMKGFPRALVGDQKNLPEFLKKEIQDAPPLSRYNGETMEMENLKPVNRSAMQMMGREGDNIPLLKMHSHSSFPKRSAAGKAKIMKTKYGQTGKAILDKNLIKPIFKKAKGNK